MIGVRVMVLLCCCLWCCSSGGDPVGFWGLLWFVCVQAGSICATVPPFPCLRNVASG